MSPLTSFAFCLDLPFLFVYEDPLRLGAEDFVSVGATTVLRVHESGEVLYLL